MFRITSVHVLAGLALLLAAASAQAASGGPDGFGYRFIDSQEPGGPSYNFLSTNNQLSASGCDDCSTSVSLPFTFSFYGGSYNSINVNSNGNATFDGSFTTWRNYELSSGSAPRRGVHPWWDDWNPSCQGNSIIKTGTSGSAPNRIFVITWENMRQYSNCSSDPVTFQVQLFEGSNDVQFHYQDTTASGVTDWNTSETVSNGGAGTIGIDGGSSPQLQFSYNSQSIASNRAIRFYDNLPPTAVAGGPFSAVEGSPATFTDGGSSDPDGTIVSYEWDCTDDGSYDGAGATFNGCTYPDEGTYWIRLRVTDDGGAQATATATINVSNAAPSISAMGGDTTGLEGGAMNWTVTASDPGSGDVLTYAWDFGDGISATTASGAGAHSYGDEGSYTVTVTVSDDASPPATDSASLTVLVENVAPTGLTLSIPSGNESELLSMSASATDSGNDVITYSWDFGDGTATAIGAAVTHTYTNDGLFTVTVTASDGDGGTVSGSAVATIANLNPSISSLPGDFSGDEGSVLNWSVVASDPGIADVLTYSWDFGDGSAAVSGASPNASHSYSDEGSYTLVLTVTDDALPAGTDSVSLIVLIANVAPTLLTQVVPSGDEGEVLVMTASGQDPGSDVLTYTWDFGDGSTLVVGTLVTHAYADEGSYTVSLSVADGDGGVDSISSVATIANVAPSITDISGDSSGDEGDLLSWVPTVIDPGINDVLLYSWDFGDGTSPESVMTPSHAFADDGTYTVTLTVDDQDGGVSSETQVVTVANVAPQISSSPPMYGQQGVVYSYLPSAVDPGADVFVWALAPSAPAAMTIDPASGEITWTPSYADSLLGSVAVTLMVDDQDGGSDVQSWSITIDPTDADGDGIADSWETDNGLDPNDPADAGGDLDGDGVSNLDEFTAGTDPTSFDGPEAPVLVSPIAGEEVDSSVPFLVLDNAFDPQGDALVYDFEVWEDAAMTVLLTVSVDVAEDSSGQSSWKVDVPLAENATVYWRARAGDGLAEGPYSALESFFVNELNAAPEVPVAQAPLDGAVLSASLPLLEWSAASDPDGDQVTYLVEVRRVDSDELAAEIAGVGGEDGAYGSSPCSPDGVYGGPTCSWTIDVVLEEDGAYRWSVAAVDEHGLEGGWSDPEDFRYSSANEPPNGVVFLAPLDGSELEDLRPLLVASEGSDPEGTELSYQFAVDTVADFSSEDLVEVVVAATGTGEVSWDPAVAGPELREDTTWYARVRGEDADGLASPWDVITFFIRGDNAAPPVPELLAPTEETLPTPCPALVVGNVADPEGDTVFYDFIVATDAELTDIVAERSNVLEGVGSEAGVEQTQWVAEDLPVGELYWSARAVDEYGASSDWARAWPLTVLSSEPDIEMLTDLEMLSGGCSCDSSLGGSPRVVNAMALLALLLLGPWMRRRP